MKPPYYWPKTRSRGIVVTKHYNARTWDSKYWSSFVRRTMPVDATLMGPREFMDKVGIGLLPESLVFLSYYEANTRDDLYFWLGADICSDF